MTSAGHGMETSWCLELSTTRPSCGTSTKVCVDAFIAVVDNLTHPSVVYL